MQNVPSIAIMIDAENISYRLLPHILKEVSRYGEIKLRAVYGDWERPSLKPWHDIAKQHEFTIRHQTSSAQKNTSDMKLIMDAMEVLYRTSIDVFCLVSNDADYVPLCQKLHESKKRVIGIGNRNASEAFIRSCDHFHFVGKMVAPKPVMPTITENAHQATPTKPENGASKSPKNPEVTPTQTSSLELKILLSQAFTNASSDYQAWVSLSALGMSLRRVKGDFEAKHYGHANLSKLLQSVPDVVEVRANGNVIQSARLKEMRFHLYSLLLEGFTKAPQDEQAWVTLSALGTSLRQIQVGFQTKHYGHANLSKLLKSMPDLIEFKNEKGTSKARLKK